MQADSTKVIWISASKVSLAVLASILLVAPVTASHYYADGGGSGTISAETGFSLPHYDSHREILTQLVAPFLLIALVLQIGLYRGLLFTLADDEPTTGALLTGDPYSKKRKRVRKQSMMLSLVITGMIVPTPFFRKINDVVAWVFGGSIYLMMGIFALAALLFLIRRL